MLEAFNRSSEVIGWYSVNLETIGYLRTVLDLSRRIADPLHRLAFDLTSSHARLRSRQSNQPALRSDTQTIVEPSIGTSAHHHDNFTRIITECAHQVVRQNDWEPFT